MHTCIHAYMHAYIHTCIHAFMHTLMHAYMHAYMRMYVHMCIHAYSHACMQAYMHTRIHSYMHTCIHAYMHTCIHTCIHACIHTCVHACMRAYTHTDKSRAKSTARGLHGGALIGRSSGKLCRPLPAEPGVERERENRPAFLESPWVRSLFWGILGHYVTTCCRSRKEMVSVITRGAPRETSSWCSPLPSRIISPYIYIYIYIFFNVISRASEGDRIS